MNTRIVKSLAALAVAGAMAVAPGNARGATKYWVQPMLPSGATSSWFSALSDTGYVNGSSDAGDFVFGKGTFTILPGGVTYGSIGDKGETIYSDATGSKLWTSTATYDLGALGISPSQVNASGQVSGFRLNAQGVYYPVLFKAGVVTEFPAVAADAGRELYLASNGFLTGTLADGVSRFFQGAVGTAAVTLPFYDLAGNDDRRRGAVNASGQVAGNFLDPAGLNHLGIWQAGALQDLATDSPGRPGVNIGTDQRAFSPKGYIAGNDAGDGFGPYGWLQTSYLYTKATNKFAWISGFGGEYTCAHDVNENGIVVGHSTFPDAPWELGGNGGPGAEYVLKNGKMYDLNKLVPAGTAFLGGYSGLINNLGQILADGSGGVAYLLTPLPVTTASALTGAGRAPGFNTSSNTTLSATDPVTGVKEIRYSLDGAAVRISAGASVNVNGLTGGSHRITYWAVDKAGHAADPEDAFFNVDRGGLLVTTRSPVVATVGTAFSVTLGATGGTAPYAFSVTGGLPPGLTLSGAVLSGTPTTAGTFSFKVTARDKAARTATSYVSVKVQPAFSITTLSPFAVSALAPAVLTAAGGQEPLTWEATTALPAGVKLFGPSILADGTQAPGAYPVTFKVTDDGGRSVTQTVTLSFP